MIYQAQDTKVVANILDKADKGIDISIEEGICLVQQQDAEVRKAIAQTADLLRQRQVGDTVTYVVNRNINFTNICEQHCSFCAFRRDADEAGSFWLDSSQIIAKAQEAVDLGQPKFVCRGV